MSERPLSYSRPADVLEMLLLGFITIEEGRKLHQKAGGNILDFEAFVAQHRGELIADEDD